ncbi:hypothetical protein [Proteus hauseri]|uniref:hypothetical protein n=1 Tax=Proteus hauseri TaxID=183417 RepID=UPI0012E87E14|nr:hypothetical protein [Proteus hauseri]
MGTPESFLVNKLKNSKKKKKKKKMLETDIIDKALLKEINGKISIKDANIKNDDYKLPEGSFSLYENAKKQTSDRSITK